MIPILLLFGGWVGARLLESPCFIFEKKNKNWLHAVGFEPTHHR